MKIKNFTGTGVALVTPFHKDGSIDFKSLESLVKNIIKGKAEFLVPLGTTGETATMSTNEKLAVLSMVIEVNNGKLPVVLGLGGNNTMHIVECLKTYPLEGVDAILSVSPYYNKPSQKGIYEHYKMIAENTSLPIILYNVPGRTASNISPSTVLQLAKDFTNIIGIKEASGNLEQVMEIIYKKPDNFIVLSGDDSLTLPMIACGADGVISVVANAKPAEFSEMVRLARKGKFDKAKELHYSVFPLIGLLFKEGNPAGIKVALASQGICKEYLRLPLVQVSKSLQKEIANLA